MNQKDIKTEILNFLENNNDENGFNRCCILAGPWGVGKTYLINQILQEKGEIYRFINVSLFGISSADDLKIRILREICKPAKKAMKALKALLGSVSLQFGLSHIASISIDLGRISDSLEDKKIEKLLKCKTNKYVVVLDDIERKDNKLSIVEVLGAVDELLKNKTIKVILVTNFDKLKFNDECEEFKEFKEKVAKHTYELNDVDEIVESILEKDKGLPFGTNLRTIYQFKEMLAYISSCSISYPLVINHIIYHVLRIEKEKIELFNYELKKRKADLLTKKTTDSELKEKISSLPRLDLVISYVMDHINIIDGEKQYTESSIKNIIKHVYLSIYEGNDNGLLTIPKPEFGVFIKVIPTTVLNNDEHSIIECIERFNTAFINNTINYSSTAEDFCDFIYSFYSANSSNERIKNSFDQSMKNYVEIIVDKATKDPSVFVDVLEGLNDATRTHSSNKYANTMRGNISKQIYIHLSQSSYKNDDFSKNIGILFSYFEIKHQLPDDFLSGFNAVNPRFIDCLDYIYDRCGNAINNVEWEQFKKFFMIVNGTGASTKYKEHARRKIGNNSIADDRYRELIALLH